MFTGIIESTGTVRDVRHSASGLRLGIDLCGLEGRVREGDSVAVNGVCLTAVVPTADRCEFDVITETVQRTQFSDLALGDRVNLERALRADARFDGHYVQGHVDAVARVADVASSAREWVLWLTLDDAIRPFVVPKGGITVNGVSLTIARVERERWSAALIPTTLDRTQLKDLRIGQRVNIETDILARTLFHQLHLLLDGAAPDLGASLERQGFR